MLYVTLESFAALIISSQIPLYSTESLTITRGFWMNIQLEIRVLIFMHSCIHRILDTSQKLIFMKCAEVEYYMYIIFLLLYVTSLIDIPTLKESCTLILYLQEINDLLSSSFSVAILISYSFVFRQPAFVS